MVQKTDPVSLSGMPAVRRAADFGVDVTLLVENLRHSPTERVRRAQRTLDSVVALRAQVLAWRQGLKQRL